MSENLMEYKVWVVAGDVKNESKFAYRILKALKAAGYKAYGYHPSSKDPEVYNDFKLLPEKPDVLDLVINPIKGLSVVKMAREAGIMKVMAQPGARSEEIEEFCKENGMVYVESCALVELGR